MANNRLMGRFTIGVDGQRFKTEKGATLDLGGPKRTTKTGSNGVAGFSEETVQSKLEFSFFIPPGLSIAAIRSWDDKVVSIETDTGQQYVINGGWVTDPQVIEESDGKTKVVIDNGSALVTRLPAPLRV